MVVFCQYHEGTIRFMPADYLASDNGHWAAEYQCPSTTDSESRGADATILNGGPGPAAEDKGMERRLSIPL